MTRIPKFYDNMFYSLPRLAHLLDMSRMDVRRSSIPVLVIGHYLFYAGCDVRTWLVEQLGEPRAQEPGGAVWDLPPGGQDASVR